MRNPNSLCSILVLAVSITLFPAILHAASAGDALTALKKFQSRCETGISYRDYGAALADANFQVKEFARSKEARQNPSLAHHISEALSHYKFAGFLWQLKIESGNYSVGIYENSAVWQAFLEMYPDGRVLMKHREYNGDDLGNVAFFSEIISYIWKQAGSEIEMADALASPSTARKSSRAHNGPK